LLISHIDKALPLTYTMIMITETILKQQIYQIIESLSIEHLNRLLHFLKTLLQPEKISGRPTTKVAPIYQLHHDHTQTLMETFGMWRDRNDLYTDGVAYMDEVRRGYRLTDLETEHHETP